MVAFAGHATGLTGVARSTGRGGSGRLTCTEPSRHGQETQSGYFVDREVTVSLSDITRDLATIRQELARHYQLNGMSEDQEALAEAIACVAAAEERVGRALSVAVG